MQCHPLVQIKLIKLMEVLKLNAMSPSCTNKTDQTHGSTKMNPLIQRMKVLK